MDALKPPCPPQESTDIFSLSDQVLSDRLQFIEEIGFGNWGSVWLCRPKPSSSSPGADGLANVPDQKLAVKLVHRSKTTTTAARVRSLWNEMKIVRTFKLDPHPSIIPFHSFIITPSYALITMAFLPTLVPVEVDELKAREWFRFLLSGVEFLHKRGVVHNDIKPANILLSHKNIPVLVDFGFAEKYDLASSKAFHSNLSYGTPEYLSPERARGLPHDTRKSDVWSLGVTFFEILVGRTPFEHSDGEQFTTKEDLEKYWSRTLRGKWVGEWKMSNGMERMLRRMVSPNADLRCTATQAMVDTYWQYRKESSALHRRSSSYTSSIVFEKDITKLMNLSPPLTENDLLETPPGLGPVKRPLKATTQIPQLAKAKSQPKIAASKIQSRKRAPAAELSPIKASPPNSPFSSAAGKENIRTFNAIASAASRKPLGNAAGRENLPAARLMLKPSVYDVKDKDRRRSRVLGDMTGNQNNENVADGGKRDAASKGKVKEKDHVRDRVREWEREKERLREMSRLEEIERERDEKVEEEKEKPAWQKNVDAAAAKVAERNSDKDNRRTMLVPSPLTSPVESVFTSESSQPPRSANDSSLSVLKHSIRKSIDMTVQLYKSSGIAQVTGRSTPALTLTADIAGDEKSISGGDSWEDDILLHNAPSTLPSVRQAAHDERVAADARMDRMTIWMRNVEKVVEDARQTFASSSTHQLVTLPSLPPAPLSRSASQTNRSSRLPRKVLTASQIFANENDQTGNDFSNVTGTFAAANSSTAGPWEGRSQLQLPEIHTPSRQRRATVSICSPEKTPQVSKELDVDTGSPSKRREKSKSHGNLFQLHITPVSLLEAELNKPELPPSSHRLSQFMDSSLFIAPPLSPRPPSSPRDEDLDMRDISIVHESPSFNDLTSSPFHVEPYPSRKSSALNTAPPDSPNQRRVEGVYDRFLMATSGVKRLGKGYQSDNTGPISSISNAKSDNHRAFHSVRRPMPPPVSSDDQRRTVSVDELGVMGYTPTSPTPGPGGHTLLKDETNTTVGLVRRAIKAMVPGKTTSRRLSRIA
ncbi:MAP/microtubule affinity-regulating kinase 4 [Hypsizygus marmoreus]|uniref:MAP/microtubule affinity-regulating kinase 4 n=1 Tax=Hypsizygus marmoreus TaxID=39966 RepID=A0A369JAD5_HYPMA|nr:MAP/microtubule affinity-regulating kinase 4 [Hypsizygus marmoreus]